MLYRIALFVHIVGAIGYFVVIGVNYVSVLGLRQARTVQVVRLWLGAPKAVMGLMLVNMLCIFGAGTYMVVTAWGWRADWAFVAIGAYVALGFASGDLQGRRIAALERAVRDLPDDAPLPAEVVARAHDAVLWLSTNSVAAGALGIVFLMAVKPGLVAALVALAIALMLGLAVGLLTQRRAEVAAVAVNR